MSPAPGTGDPIAAEHQDSRPRQHSAAGRHGAGRQHSAAGQHSAGQQDGQPTGGRWVVLPAASPDFDHIPVLPDEVSAALAGQDAGVTTAGRPA